MYCISVLRITVRTLADLQKCKYGLGVGEVSVYCEPLENQIWFLVVGCPSCSVTTY